MAGKVTNLSFVLLSNFVSCRQKGASKTATSHIRKPLVGKTTIIVSLMTEL